MTLLHDYASMMLDCYLEDDEHNEIAIRHYLELKMQERMKMEVEARRLESIRIELE